MTNSDGLSKTLTRGSDQPSCELSSFHEKLLDSLYDGVYFVDTERRITYWNQGAERLTGYARSEAVGRRCFDNFLAHVDDEGSSLCMNGCPLAATIRDGECRSTEIYLRHRLGYRVPVCVRVAPIFDAGGCVVGAVEIFSDASAKKRVERRAHELEALAFRDSLTGGANRRYVELKVQQAVEEYRQFGRRYALMLIDVDHFKRVNDKFGHSVGDAVLKTVFETLAHSLRARDVVGRWGGEEFLVILADATLHMLGDLADRCRQLIAKSAANVQNTRIRVTVSLGATLINTADSPDSAIKRADQLMYRSKAAGRNRATVG